MAPPQQGGGSKPDSIFKRRPGSTSISVLDNKDKEKQQSRKNAFGRTATTDTANDLKSLEELEPPRAFQKYEDQHYDVFDIKDVNAPVDESIDSPSVDFLRLAKEAEHLKYPWEEMESIVEDGGVRKRVLRPGQFSNLPTKLNQVKDGHRVWIHYNTYIDERTRLTLLDSTVGHRLATTLRVGEDGLPGLYHAVRSMIRNEISEFCFEPEYGYGRFGVPSFIGGNQRLRIILELMDIGKHSRKSAVFMNELEKLSANLSLREVLDDVEKLKEAGNAKVERELYRDACDRYNWAIDLLKNYRNGEESQLTPEDETIDKKMFQLYSNLALCFIRLEDFEEVENMCENALNLVHEDMDLKPKVLYRYATACYRLQRYDLSMKLCERGIQNCIWGHAQFRSLLYNVTVANSGKKDKMTEEEIETSGESESNEEGDVDDNDDEEIEKDIMEEEDELMDLVLSLKA